MGVALTPRGAALDPTAIRSDWIRRLPHKAERPESPRRGPGGVEDASPRPLCPNRPTGESNEHNAQGALSHGRSLIAVTLERLPVRANGGLVFPQQAEPLVEVLAR